MTTPMVRVWRLLSTACLLALAASACAEKPGYKGTGGTSGSGSGGATGAGGRAATGGATASCGTSDAGGESGAAGSAGGAGGEAGAGAGGTGTAPSCAGNAISFSANGTGSASDAAHARVMVDLMDDLPIANAARTVEFWAYVRKTDWVGETNTIFEYGTQATSAAGFGLDFGGVSGTIDPYTNGGWDNDNQPTCLNVTVDQWVHFAMTWDGKAVRTYVNGVVRSTKTNASSTAMLATAKSFLTIGCNNPRFSCFGGYIDEFRVWKVARSAAEIAANYDKGLAGNEDGLVGYWKFNEAPGAMAAADSVTTAGHVAHAGMPMAVMATQLPTFVTPEPPAPIRCP